MNDEPRRVTLSKADRNTIAGRELIALLTELSADGQVTREEMGRLRAWLEVDHGVVFPAFPFLHETIEQMSSDGEITEDELDRLALAIERVLPKDVRIAATLKQKQDRGERRLAERETRRQTLIATRTEARAVREAAQARAGVICPAHFPVRGAMRSAERREACERLVEGDTPTLEREPDNTHDPNAIVVLGDGDCEIGYVPREDAQAMAPLLDAGAEAEATVRRLWETPEGQIVPILLAKVRRGETNAAVIERSPLRRATGSAPANLAPRGTRRPAT